MPDIIGWLIEIVESFGYLGIFVMTLLESTFLPIPSEITMIPAAYLVAQGKMNVVAVFLSSVLGTVLGASINYAIARKFGRPFIEAHKKYFFLDDKRITKIDNFFNRHGEISMLTGRLVPGVRHFISLPAGFAGMKVERFVSYTAIGASIWMSVLLAVGYFLGGDKVLVEKYSSWIGVGATALALLFATSYALFRMKKERG